MKSLVNISTAPQAWKLLNGVFCIYKPRDVSMKWLRDSIPFCLCRDLNEMDVRPPTHYVQIEGSAERGDLTVTNVPNLADTPEVLGPRYQPDDIKIFYLNHMLPFATGLCVVAINKGGPVLNKLRKGNYLRTYEVCGQFGYATHDYLKDGRVLEKTTYDHIKQEYIDRTLSAWQAGHQKQMYKYAGVDIQSQEAFRLAVQGPLRPADKSVTMIYNLKCIKFTPPDFTIEVQCINEDHNYLKEMIHDLGIEMKSTAVCTKLRLTRYGYFTVDLALLRKHWTVSHIITNIARCSDFIDKELFNPKTPLITEQERGKVKKIV